MLTTRLPSQPKKTIYIVKKSLLLILLHPFNGLFSSTNWISQYQSQPRNGRKTEVAMLQVKRQIYLSAEFFELCAEFKQFGGREQDGAQRLYHVRREHDVVLADQYL